MRASHCLTLTEAFVQTRVCLYQRPNKGIVLEYLEPNPAVAPCLNYSTNLLSPLVVLNKNILSPGNTLGTVLSSPVEGKVKFQKPIQASSLDLSCVDLTTTHPSWEVSLVKAIVESPNPINLSAPPEASMMWSGTSPHPNVSEELQRSWKEMVPTIPDLREKQNSSNLAI
ncbi:hypothetical protein M9458_053406 [Cirrhinus mrigala]|uniref:Uncharacterized protein n=1 Tax=Cirrhinus mrigala TaxID=683832 RepID=A0ABD0MQE8_CIRMR